VGEITERAGRDISHCSVWKSPCGREHRESLHRDIGDAHLAGECVAAGGEQEGVDNQVGPFEGGAGIPRHLWGNGENIIPDGMGDPQRICAGFVEPDADLFRITGQRCERDCILGSEIRKTPRGSQPHAVTSLLQADRER